MSDADARKVYRPPLLPTSLGWLVFAGFFVVGLSMVTVGPSQHDGASAVAVGALVLLLSLWLGAVLATNRLIVTAAGLVYSCFLRRRAVSWADVQSFDVGASRTIMRWPTLLICRYDGSILVTNLASFTRTYPARVADELTACQRRLAPAALGQAPDHPPARRATR